MVSNSKISGFKTANAEARRSGLGGQSLGLHGELVQVPLDALGMTADLDFGHHRWDPVARFRKGTWSMFKNIQIIGYSHL